MCGVAASVALVAVGIGCLLVCILVPVAFEDLEYYQMGFVRNKASGKVDTSKVYFGGRHFIGVMGEFKIYWRRQFYWWFKNYDVFTKEKMKLKVWFSTQFRLRPEDLHLLHDVYGMDFEKIITATIESSLRAASIKYTVEQFRLNRTMVAFGIKDMIGKNLDGNCCRKDCKTNDCRPGCKRYQTCKSTEKGLYTELTGFQLGEVNINDAQTQRYLRQVLEQEKKDTERYIQEEKVTRKKIEEEKAKIQNLANEVLQDSYAKSRLIRSKSTVKAKAIIDSAQNSGLSVIYKELNITDMEHKKTLDYVRVMRNHESTNMYIGFQYMVARP